MPPLLLLPGAAALPPLLAALLCARGAAAVAVDAGGGGGGGGAARFTPLARLGPRMVFRKGVNLTVAGRPGEPPREVPQLTCEGWYCRRLPVASAACTHDPATAEDMLSIMWTCDEEVASAEVRVPRGGPGPSTFSFQLRRVECDSNVSAARGLAVVAVDTGNVSLPAGVDAEEERVFVDPATCRMAYVIANHGAPQEKWSLALILVLTIMFVLVAICPAGTWTFGRGGSSGGGIDPAHMPPPPRARQHDEEELAAAGMRRRGARTMHHRDRNPGASIRMGAPPSDTFPIDAAF